MSVNSYDIYDVTSVLSNTILLVTGVHSLMPMQLELKYCKSVTRSVEHYGRV